MKHLILILFVLLLVGCSPSRPDYITFERSETDTPTQGDFTDVEEVEVEEIDVSAANFGGSFFSGTFEYRGITLHSSYEQMVARFGEPLSEEFGIDGVYYDYEHIGFNFPMSVEDSDPSELRINGFIVPVDDMSKMEAVNTFGWPINDDVINFRMDYSNRGAGDKTILMNYDWQDNVTAMIYYNDTFESTELYEQDQDYIESLRADPDDDDDDDSDDD